MSFRKALKFLAVLLAASTVLGIVGCTRQDPGVWARVDGTPIRREQVEAIYRARQAALPGEAKPAEVLSFKLAILNDLIDRALLLRRAADLHIQVSTKDVDARLAQIGGPALDGLQDHSPAGSLSPAALRKQAEDSLAIQKLIQREVFSAVKVTPAEITAYYEHNKTEFDVPEAEVHLAGILVTPVPDSEVRNLMRDDARNEREAERKIAALYLQVRTGKDFAKVAEDYSEDPRTAPGGGDMGFLPVSRFAPDRVLSRTLKSLKPGQITGIIRDRAGFHIFKLLGRVSAGQRQISDPGVQDSIRKTLTNEKVELLKAAYIESLRNHARVTDYLAQEILRDHGPSAATQ